MEKSGKMLNNHQIIWEWVYFVRTRNLSTSGTTVEEHAMLYLKIGAKLNLGLRMSTNFQEKQINRF
jgi:hypothetical protein